MRDSKTNKAGAKHQISRKFLAKQKSTIYYSNLIFVLFESKRYEKQFFFYRLICSITCLQIAVKMPSNCFLLVVKLTLCHSQKSKTAALKKIDKPHKNY